MRGRVIRSTGSWYEIEEEQDKYRVKARLRGIFKLANLKVTNPVAVGDWVVFEKERSGTGEYEIVEIEPRENYIIRKSTHKTAHDHLIATNVDQVLVLFTLSMPRTSVGFLDRALVTAEAYRIPTIIGFNKCDIYNEKQAEKVKEYIQVYESIGYTCYSISAIQNIGTEGIKNSLKDKVTLVMGHSGVGKSTLMNTLYPGLNLKTSEVSKFAEKGTHTTTFAEMFALDDDSYIIDTPGIKELGISEIQANELSHYFPEMRKIIGKCRFHNCRHLNEPDCAVIEEVKAGNIEWFRYESYLSILTGEDNRK